MWFAGWWLMTMVVITPAKRQRQTPPRDIDFNHNAQWPVQGTSAKGGRKEISCPFRVFMCGCFSHLEIALLLLSRAPRRNNDISVVDTHFSEAVFFRRGNEKTHWQCQQQDNPKMGWKFCLFHSISWTFFGMHVLQNHCLSYPLLSHNCLSCCYVEYADIMERQGKKGCRQWLSCVCWWHWLQNSICRKKIFQLQVQRLWFTLWGFIMHIEWRDCVAEWSFRAWNLERYQHFQEHATRKTRRRWKILKR